jgi:hypothetical protein
MRIGGDMGPANGNDSNHWTGHKYLPGQDIVDIARNVRRDIADAIKAGILPACTVQVRISRYSMGQSLSVTIVKLSQSFNVSEDGPAVLDTMRTIANAYNYDRSDCTSDHFDCNFHLRVHFSHEVEEADRARSARNAIAHMVTEDVQAEFIALRDLAGDEARTFEHNLCTRVLQAIADGAPNAKDLASEVLKISRHTVPGSGRE